MEYAALFPLGICLLPGQEKELHIFESRYKQLFADCLIKDISFGIPFIKDGQIAEYGTTAKLTKIVKKYPTGELDVIITGEQVFKLIDIQEKHTERDYPAGKIQRLATDYLKANKRLSFEFIRFANNFLPNANFITNSNFSIYHIACLLGLSEEDKYEILACFSNGLLNNKLLNRLRIKSAITRQERELKGKYHLN